MVKEINNGTLFFDGVDTVSLAKKYGTPLYVYSENAIMARINELKRDFLNKYDNTRAAYAAKAFFPVAMAQLVGREGICADVVSGGELYTAIKAGLSPERIEFNGNNKQAAELELAVAHDAGRIIIDSLWELGCIESICREKGKRAKVLFRIAPGVKTGSHDYLVTGTKDSKFGIPLEENILMPLLKAAIDSEYVDFYGLHFHVGSQLFENESHLRSLTVLLEIAAKVRDTYGYEFKEINIGGGFGAAYTNEDRKPYSFFLDPVMVMIERHYSERNLARPAVVIEPGRSIVAEAGITLYTIGSIKEIPGIRKYVSVDGGMTDNIRPALYQAKYTGIIANKADKNPAETVTVCGKCCESGDILIKDLSIPKPDSGDTFAVFSTGAYGYSMASNYNKNPIPAVVMVKDGTDKLIVERQTYENMIARELPL